MAHSDIKYQTLNLYDSLTTAYQVAQLKSLLRHISKKKYTRKADIVKHIVLQLTKNLNKIIAGLKPVEINALSEAVYNWNGYFKGDRFAAKYGKSPFQRAGHLSGELSILYLFFMNGRNIPEDLIKQLKTLIPEPDIEQIAYSDTVNESDLIVQRTEYAAMMNLNMLLLMINENKIKVSKSTGKPTAAAMKKISMHLYAGDFYEDEQVGSLQAFSWPLLLQGGGLAEVSGTGLRLSKQGKSALKKELALTIKSIFKKWEKTRLFDEYSRVTAVKGQKASKGRAMASPVKRRPVINDALSCLKPGKWVTVDEFARFMISEDYTFPMVNYEWKLYFGDPHYGSLGYCDIDSILHLRYLLIYCFEYCATLGLIDVAYKHPDNARNGFRSCWGADGLDFLSHCDGLMQIKLNDLGAFVFGISEKYGSDSINEYEIQKTDIIFTGKTDPIPDHVLYLEKIAEQTEVNRWHISFNSLLNAVKEGKTINEIKKFIKQITSQKHGEALEKLFKKADRRGSAVIKKGSATLLECQAQIHRQILVDKHLSRLCLRAGKHHIVILPGKDKLFARKLEALGLVIGK